LQVAGRSGPARYRRDPHGACFPATPARPRGHLGRLSPPSGPTRAAFAASPTYSSPRVLDHEDPADAFGGSLVGSAARTARPCGWRRSGRAVARRSARMDPVARADLAPRPFLRRALIVMRASKLLEVRRHGLAALAEARPPRLRQPPHHLAGCLRDKGMNDRRAWAQRPRRGERRRVASPARGTPGCAGCGSAPPRRRSRSASLSARARTS
jgi:hypothetical protein